jgi:DNA-binding CsgD family transcriptional regulator
MAVIGREEELARIATLLDDARPGARGILIVGDAGIGTSTVLSAAAEMAAMRGFRVLTARPVEAEAGLPFAGLSDLLGELVDAGEPALPAPQRTALDVALMRAEPPAEPIQPLAISLAVLELLRVTSGRQPVALAVDDAQWLDDSTAGVLRFALRRLERERIVIVAGARRSGDDAIPPILTDLPSDRLEVVPLAGLGQEDVDRLLDESLGLRLAPTALQRVARLSAGNPFHALEIGGTYVAGGSDVAVPASLGRLVRERLAGLSPGARAVALQVAALAQPTESMLAAALGRDAARSGFTDARDAGILDAGPDPIRFAQPLVAGELLASIGDDERRDLHRRLAEVVDDPAERARHLALAATGPDDTVAAALDEAAVTARARGASDAAADLSELAARLTPEQDPDRGRRIAAAGRYRVVAGDIHRARTLLEDALATAAGADGAGRADLLTALAQVRQLMDDHLAAGGLAEEALAHVGDDRRLAIRAKELLAGVSYITGRRWEAGAAHAFEAMRLAEELGDPDQLAITIGPYLSWRFATGQPSEPAVMARADELAPMMRSLRAMDRPDYALIGVDLADGQTASAAARVGRLLDDAERDGDYSSLPFILAHAAAFDFLEGRTDDARERIGRSRRLADVTEQRTARVNVLSQEARLLARLGDADGALAAAGEAFDLMDATGWRFGEWPMRVDLALLELSRGDASASLAFVEGALTPPTDDESGRHRWALPTAAEALVALGRTDEAHAALELVPADAPRRLRADALRARGRLLAAVGDPGAEAVLDEAEAIHREMGDRWELARTLLVAGEARRRGRHRARARSVLREALELFAFLGARRWADLARDLLARIDAPRRDDGLTPTQREVAELVVIGLTNRQVADRLFMSPHTVEAHLKAIYRTLEIGSRGELRDAIRDSARGSRDSTAS